MSGISTCVVYTPPDAASPVVRSAAESVLLDGSAGYLDMDSIVAAAVKTKCDAIHPGSCNQLPSLAYF